MSKPKPGLSKSLVRTLSTATSAQYPLPSSNVLTLAPVSQYGSGASSSASAFMSLGLPSSSLLGTNVRPCGGNTGWPTFSGGAGGYDILVPTWDQSDIVVTHSSTSRSSMSMPARFLSHSLRPLTSSTSPGMTQTSKKYSTVAIPTSHSVFFTPDRVFYPSTPAQVSLDALLAALDVTTPPTGPRPTGSGVEGFESPRSPPSPKQANQSLKSRTSNPVQPTIQSPPPLSSSPAQSSLYTSTLPPGGIAAEEGPEGMAGTAGLIFHAGASGLAKDRLPFKPPAPRPAVPPRQRTFHLEPVHSPTSREMKSTSVGEDAYFTRIDGLCVADGVGSWARSGRGGADAGRWSALLAHFCELEVGGWCDMKEPYVKAVKTTGMKSTGKGKGKEVQQDGEEGEKERRPLDPVEIMQRGYEKCLSCAISEGINGSSTCLVALLHNSTLHVANLGDCCLLVIRQGKVVFRTEEMQHAFNFPLQVGTHSRDEPMKDAMRFDVPVKMGDVVVVGSDGLMDNMFDEDILETLSSLHPSIPITSSQFPQQASETLANRALSISKTTTTTTPFMCAALEEGIDFVGGKKDDISVLVGVVGDREDGEGQGLMM